MGVEAVGWVWRQFTWLGTKSSWLSARLCKGTVITWKAALSSWAIVVVWPQCMAELTNALGFCRLAQLSSAIPCGQVTLIANPSDDNAFAHKPALT